MSIWQKVWVAGVANLCEGEAVWSHMKWTCYLLACGIFLAPLSDQAAETARTRMYCMSLRFQRSEDQSGFFYLDLTTLSSGVNGELAFGDFFNAGYSHSTFIILTDTLFGDPYEGAMALDIPPFSDANGNTYPDFLKSRSLSTPPALASIPPTSHRSSSRRSRAAPRSTTWSTIRR